jgi:hypothetical protein
MNDYLFCPGISVGPVLLGMSQDQVRSVIAIPPKPFTRGKTHIDAFSSLQVNYAADRTVKFIEIAPYFDTRLRFEGRDLLSLTMRELVAVFSAHEPYTLSEGTTYQFPSLRVALWRGIPFDAELDGQVESISTWTPNYWK